MSALAESWTKHPHNDFWNKIPVHT